jgi:hypothetical protein
MADSEERRGGGFNFRVNGQIVRFPDSIVTGREALTKAGLLPASEQQLTLVRGGRTHLVGTDDNIDLSAGGVLRAFEGDRSYSFSVDEVSQFWGAPEMEVDEFVEIWPLRAGHEWLLERADEADTVLTRGGLLSFGPEGVEHVVSRKIVHSDHVMVTVVTTAGTFPAEGAKRYPSSKIIADVLKDAAHKLKTSGTENWVVTVDGRDISPTLSFAQAGLSGSVELEWGAREGGGGA